MDIQLPGKASALAFLAAFAFTLAFSAFIELHQDAVRVTEKDRAHVSLRIAKGSGPAPWMTTLSRLSTRPRRSKPCTTVRKAQLAAEASSLDTSAGIFRHGHMTNFQGGAEGDHTGRPASLGDIAHVRSCLSPPAYLPFTRSGSHRAICGNSMIKAMTMAIPIMNGKTPSQRSIIVPLCTPASSATDLRMPWMT